MNKRTKIVATIGPASQNKKILQKMIQAGMDVARLNFSHGTYENHAELIANIRAAAKKVGKTIAIMQDLQGPRIRVGSVHADGIDLQRGDAVVLVPESQLNGRAFASSKETVIPIGVADLHKYAKPQKHILINDGLIDILVTKVAQGVIYGTVEKPGIIFSHKGINMPGVTITTNVITQKDKQDLKFGLSQHVDYVALSFVKDAKDVQALRKLMGKKTTKIVAKIERHEALQNIDEIIEAADAIMIARGDLGIEIKPEEVPLAQKDIIQKCMYASKPVIVATQMLESMIINPRPTRAEVSDVANAVIDHTDAVMLSGESAFGKYPVESVSMMADIIQKTEGSKYDDVPLHFLNLKKQTVEDAMSVVANDLSQFPHVQAVVVHSLSGDAALKLSRHRPKKPIITLTNHETTGSQLSLSWGVRTLVVPTAATIDGLLQATSKALKKSGMVKKGEYIVLVSGEPVGKSGGMNMVKLHKVT